MNGTNDIWLEKFLFKRDRLLEPDGRELFRYRMTEKEYDELCRVLRGLIVAITDAEHLAQLARSWYFCRLFVLYCAEWWRRRYDGTGFSWEPIIQDIGGNPAAWNQQQRSRCIETGFLAWQVPLRQHGGLRYIISVALQGGLPLKLLAKGKGAIGQVLKKVLYLASNSSATQQEIEGWVASLRHRLPDSYQQPAIYLLLASIIETVLRLKIEANLTENSRVIDQLNERIPGWRERFPLPMEDGDAQGLIAQLLCDAASQGACVPGVLFPLKRQLENNGESWNLYSTLDYSELVDAKALASFFAVTDALPQQADLTLRVEGKRQSVRIRRLAGQEKYRLERQLWEIHGGHSAATHTLELSAADGRLWHAMATQGEELDDELPWLFSAAEPYLFLRQGSGKVAEPTILLALPQGWSVQPGTESACEVKGSLPEFTRILWQVQGEVQARNPAGEQCGIKTNRAEAAEERYVWSGKRLWYDFLSPSQAFLGPPRLYRVSGDGNQRAVDGMPHFSSPTDLGPVIARYPANGELRWRSRMVLLPDNASLTLQSTSPVAGKICLHYWGATHGHMLTPGIDMVVRQEERHTLAFDVTVAEGGRSPEKLELELLWPHTVSPVRLSLPFPAKGVRAFAGDGHEWQSRTTITLQQLAGARILVYTGQHNGHVALQLRTTMDAATRAFDIRPLPNSLTIVIRPQDYFDDMQHLLACHDDLDASVSMEVIVDGIVEFSMDIARYAAHLIPQENTCVLNESARAMIQKNSLPIPPVHALNLVQIEDESYSLTAKKEECGMWSFDPQGWSPGPWLLYPAPESPLAIRPLLWPVDGEIETESHLARAMGVGDYADRQKELDAVMNELASDFLHPDWSSLELLAGRLGHLSLTCLDVWRVLSLSPRGIAALAFRVGEVPNEFCRRFPLELPFTWEVVPFSAWKEAIKSLEGQCRTLYGEENGKKVMHAHLKNVCEKLAADYPALNYLLGIARADFYPEAQQETMALRLGLAPQATDRLFLGDDCQLQHLLRRHSEDHWPTGCEAVLSHARKDTACSPYLCPERHGFHDPVINLPLLLAAQCATGHSHEWLRDPARISLLRTCRSFDPDWFAEAYNLTMARSLADGLLDQPNQRTPQELA